MCVMVLGALALAVVFGAQQHLKVVLYSVRKKKEVMLTISPAVVHFSPIFLHFSPAGLLKVMQPVY